MAAFYGIPCYPPTRESLVRLGNLYPNAVGWTFVNEHNGPACLGNTPPTNLPACSASRRANCAYREKAGNVTAYQGGAGPVEPEYRFQTISDMFANDTRFADEKTRPARYRGPVDGTIGGANPTNLPNIQAGALPYFFSQKTGAYNEKLLSRHAGASQAVQFTNINTGAGYGFAPEFLASGYH